MKNTFWVVLTAKKGVILKSDVKKFDQTITGIRKTKIARHFLTQEDCRKHIESLKLSRSYNISIVTDSEFWECKLRESKELLDAYNISIDAEVTE